MLPSYQHLTFAIAWNIIVFLLTHLTQVALPIMPHRPSPLSGTTAAKGARYLAPGRVNCVKPATQTLPFRPHSCIGRAKILNPCVRKAPR